MFENPTINLTEICNSCAKIACCSTELKFAFLCVGSSIQNASMQFVSCIHVSFENSLFINKPLTNLGLEIRTSKGRRNQLDVTHCFIELVICSTCFGHFYAHHQELATILLVWHVACNSWLLVDGRSGAEQQAVRPDLGMLFDVSRTANNNVPHPLRLDNLWPAFNYKCS